LTRIAFVYPGQAAQRPDMARPWRTTAHAAVFEEVGGAAGVDLLTLADDAMACGASTALAQPAIYATALAAHDALIEAGIRPTVLAGHSLGEVTAAAAAGVLDRRAAAGLVAERGRAMGEACAAMPGAMAAVVRLDEEQIERLVRATSDVSVANTNAPGQTVLSGTPEAIDGLASAVRELGGRLLPLQVEGAFHSPAMTPAMVRLDALLGRVDLGDPAVPVVSGTDGLPKTTAAAIRTSLVDGMLAPVRWVDVQYALAAMVDAVIEVGPGDILRGCAKRTIPTVPFFSVSTPDDVAAAATELHMMQPGLAAARA